MSNVFLVLDEPILGMPLLVRTCPKQSFMASFRKLEGESLSSLSQEKHAQVLSVFQNFVRKRLPSNFSGNQ